MMHGHGKSDSSIVRTKPPNEAEPEAKEAVDGRGLAKGNLLKRNMSRTQGRPGMPSALERIRQATRRDKRQRFTALLHHVYDVERLRAAYFALRREAAPGIDGETWRHYGEKLQSNLEDLSERVKRGAYRAKPVRRAYIAKVGKPGELRPLGVPVLEDKIVQRATVEVFNALYEEDFVGFSYGFRPNRSPHHALDALTLGIMRSKVNWVLDCDIRAFFDTLEHGWLVKFIEHRVADRRVVRLLQKWLKAGVVEEGKRRQSEIGTVQGGSISPLRANIYLHYVFDLWIEQWRRGKAHGDVIVVRFADDLVVGLERGEGKPNTFNFLGFTHSCGKTRQGKFVVLRQTMRRRWQAKLKQIKEELRQRMHESFPEMGRYLRSVVAGHMRYYAVPMNVVSVSDFRLAGSWIWWRVLKRRSQRTHLPWTRMKRHVARWLPQIHICHPYP